MFYVAIIPPIVEHLLLLPGNPGGGDGTHQSVEAKVVLAAKFQVTGIEDSPVTGLEHLDHILGEVAV